MENKSILLQELNIQNFATFKSEQVFFKQGLNTIVGETGSGKSLILDALQFIFGQRADKKTIRKGADFASLEAIFSCHSPRIHNYLMNMGFPFEDNQIVIKRILQSNGKSKIFLNHQVSTIKNVQEFSHFFIDFVGQFSNQKLLNPKYQLEMLDSYAGLEKTLTEYEKHYQHLKSLEKKYQNIQEGESDRLRKIDYLQYQLKEVQELNPSSQEEKELINKKEFYKNFEKKMMLNQEIQNIISNDNGILDMIRSIKSRVIHNEDLFTHNQFNFLEDTLEQFSDLDHQLSLEANQEFNEEELENVIDKIDRYQQIKRKLGPTIEDVLKNEKNFQEQLEELENSQSSLASINEQINLLHHKVHKIAQTIHDQRKKNVHLFSKELILKLQKLNMPNVKIDIQIIKQDQLYHNGFDKINFKIETNAGEGFFHLQEVASGGELSRILLSIREIHARHNSNISIFLFDEIDTGIGGNTAVAMGRELKAISQNSQVIAITHLPQIAQFSDFLLEVSKMTKDSEDSEDKTKRTVSIIKSYEHSHILNFAKEMTPLN